MNKNKIISFIAIFSFISGLILIGYTGMKIMNQNEEQKVSLQKIKEILKTKEPPIPKSSQPIKDDWITGDTIGILEIPSLKKELAIIEGTDEDELERGVGHYSSTSLPGENNQILLSGHRDTVFRKLGKLQIGDKLKIHTTNGVYEYQIFQTYIVKSDNNTVIRNTSPKEILTLSTCYPFSFIGNAPDRYIIEAELVK